MRHLFVCSQSSFYVTRARKEDKNRPNTLFCFTKLNLLPDKKLFKNVHFESTKNRKKELCVWTTKYKRLFEMCIVQHVEMKSVFTFQSMKRLFYTTINSAKSAATI